MLSPYYLMSIVTIRESNTVQRKKTDHQSITIDTVARGLNKNINQTEVKDEIEIKEDPEPHEEETETAFIRESDPVQRKETDNQSISIDTVARGLNENANQIKVKAENPEPDEEETETASGTSGALKFVCHICNSDTKMSEKQLRKHAQQEHKGQRLRCLKLHAEHAVQCGICARQFRTAKSLRKHMETHSNHFVCETCNTIFKKLLNYTIHLRRHNPEDTFKCVLCDFQTDSINDITDHVNSLHDQNYKYTCEKCGRRFHVLSWFQEHGNYHTGEKPFECEKCGKQFPYSHYLTAHRNGVHKEDVTVVSNPHVCVICKKQYRHRNSLRLHMNVHTGHVAVCDVCGKKLSSNEKLKFHMRTHTGYKPFNCSHCKKCFSQKPTLVEHERTHTGEKPYTCNCCSRGFSQRTSLVIHMRGHTGERPYGCHLCNMKFVSRSMLNLHFRTCDGPE